MNKGKREGLRGVSTLVLIFISILFFVGCNRAAEEDYRKAEELWEAEKYKESLAHYEKVIYENPKGHLATDSLYQIGNIYYLNLRDYHRAIDAYRKLVERSPSSPFSPDAQIKIAEIHRDKLGDLKGAIAAYRHFSKIYPNEADKAVYQIAQCYELLKEFDNARNEYKKILEEFPDIDYRDKIEYLIADSFYLEGKTNEARNALEDFLERFPDSIFSTDAMFEIALTYEEEGNLEEALARLQQLKGIYPDGRVLGLRISGIQERIEAKKRPAPPKQKIKLKKN